MAIVSTVSLQTMERSKRIQLFNDSNVRGFKITGRKRKRKKK